MNNYLIWIEEYVFEMYYKWGFGIYGGQGGGVAEAVKVTEFDKIADLGPLLEGCRP